MGFVAIGTGDEAASSVRRCSRLLRTPNRLRSLSLSAPPRRAATRPVSPVLGIARSGLRGRRSRAQSFVPRFMPPKPPSAFGFVPRLYSPGCCECSPSCSCVCFRVLFCCVTIKGLWMRVCVRNCQLEFVLFNFVGFVTYLSSLSSNIGAWNFLFT